MKKLVIIIGLLFGLAIATRIYKLSEVPLSLNWDEAAFGYNAYSLLLTGKDEYGQFMPLQFLSIGDYKCPLYIYLLVPAIKIFGLNEWAIRIVPALLGTLTIPLVFILTKGLFKSTRVATAAAFFLAVSPWHLQFTRAGADVGVSTFFLILGVTLAVRNKLILAGISLGLTIYAYFGERAFTPLMLLLLITYLGKRSLQMWLAFGLTVLPVLLVLISGGHVNKITNTSLVGYKSSDEAIVLNKQEDYLPLVNFLFHNPVVEKSQMIAIRYISHFSPVFWFINGPEDGRQRIDGMGMLYRSDAILLIGLIVWMAKTKPRSKNFWLVIGWLLIAPLPAAITRDPVHARRAFNMTYPISILLALGADYLWENRKKYWLVFGSYIVAAVWSMTFYAASYYILTPQTTYLGAAGWQYGYKQLVSEIDKVKSQYNQVVVDTSYQGPYIFFLFYEKYSPGKYQAQAKLVRPKSTDLGEGPGYDNFAFRNIYWPYDRNSKNTLYAGPPERIPLIDIRENESRLLKTILFPDGKEAWRIVSTVKE